METIIKVVSSVVLLCCFVTLLILSSLFDTLFGRRD